MTGNPWNDPQVASQQRALIDRQLGERPWPRHLGAFADAVRATKCPGTILEIGCASGYGREILDRAGLPYRTYSGIDISEPALAIARERYPESWWDNPDLCRLVGESDIVIDGCSLMHVEDWRAHLASVCAASRRWVILHRVPTSEGPTERTTTKGYGREFPAWRFAVDDIVSAMKAHGFSADIATAADGDSDTLVFAKPRHFASYCDRNYLPKMKALHASMLRHCGPFVLHVLAWDEEVAAWAEHAANVEVMRADRLIAEFDESPRGSLRIDALPGPRRTTVEHYWTVGPAFIAAVMALTGQPVTYVDADCFFHSSPEPLFAEIGAAPAGVIPHGFAKAGSGLPGPREDTHGVFGRFNVGIVHFNELRVATDWAEQCRLWCYDRLEPGRYGDQKYLETFVEKLGAHVVQYPGACPGPWSIHTRALDVRDGVIHFGGRPLIGYHFSGLRELPDGHSVASRPEYLLTERQEAIIYAPYYRALREAR